MRCTGHNIVKRKEKQGDETVEFDMLKVTCEGTGSDGKNKFAVEVDPEMRGDWPLEEICEVEVVFPQQRLKLKLEHETAEAGR